MHRINPYFLYTYIGLIALAVGSFLNVLIYRLPLMLQAEWKKDCQALFNLPPQEMDAPINLFFPRSFCPSCKMLIPAYYNIPLLSYLHLRGKCKNCQAAIGIRYPLVEALTCILSLLAVWHFGFSYQLLFALFFIWIQIALIFIDFDRQLLPDCLTLPLLWLGLLANTQSLFTSLNNAVISAVLAYLFLWGLIRLYYLMTGKIGMGNGDFKLFAAFGAWFGWTQLPLILLFSSLLGAIIGFAYLSLAKKGHDTPIPFGPFLCSAGLCSLFFGPSFFAWYIRLWA